MREDEYKEFLNRFPANKRSTIMNQFCFAYREGNTDVDSILAWVMKDALDRCSDSMVSVSDIEIQRDLYGYCEGDELARCMAEYVIWWEGLDWRVKDEIKKARKGGYVETHMAVQPPTDKQLKYLRGLGCGIVPKTKLEASRLIDGILKNESNRNAEGASQGRI